MVLDPGHGGSDSGATRTGLREADVVLDLARRIEGRLTAIGVDVVFTRTETTCPTDEERAAIANRSGADVVLSLHCDSHDHVDASGVATFFFGRDRRNAWSAIGEHLADLVLREVVARTPLANCRSHGRSWTLLQQTTMPTVRVEGGLVEVPDGEVGPRARHRVRARLADPGRASRDDRDLAVQLVVDHVVPSPFRLR